MLTIWDEELLAEVITYKVKRKWHDQYGNHFILLKKKEVQKKPRANRRRKNGLVS